MKYSRFFDGTYIYNEPNGDEKTFKITPLINPNGFVIEASNGAKLQINIYDALDFVDKIEKPCYITLKDLKLSDEN